MALRPLLWRVLSHVTRWPSGWNVDRQKRDCEDHDRIKRDFRDVETSAPPLLYSCWFMVDLLRSHRSPHHQRAPHEYLPALKARLHSSQPYASSDTHPLLLEEP
jgi:hypothetical protein